MMPNKAVGRGRADDAARATRRGSLALASLIALGSVACGPSDNSSTGPQVPGAIAVSTQTSGFQRDDSYQLLVDGQSAGIIGANDVVTVGELDPATYQLALGDVAENCTVEGATATVTPEATATATLTVTCTPADPIEYSVRANRDRLNLEDGTITVCSFGVCPTNEGWDFYAEFTTASNPAVVYPNATTGVTLAAVAGKTLETLTEADVDGATFTTDPVDPFDSGTVVLVKTDTGSVYGLGNPVLAEVSFTLYLTFDAVQLQ